MLSNEDQMSIIKQAIAEKRPEPMHELLTQAEQGAAQAMEVAETPQEYQEGLRNQPEGTSMAFPNSSGSFNTKGMDYNIDMKKYSPDGDLVRSYESVPPGVENIPMGDDVGTVIETPAEYQSGGLKQDTTKYVSKHILNSPHKYQTGGNHLLTYKDNSDYFDSHAIYSDNQKYDDLIRKRVYSGNWGYDPNTQQLHKLNKSQQTKVDPKIKKLAFDQRSDIDIKDLVAHTIPKENAWNPYGSDLAGTTQWVTSERDKEMRQEELAHNAAISGQQMNTLFSIPASVTPVGMAIMGMQGATNLATQSGPDFIKNPSLSTAGAAGLDLLTASPLTIPAGKKLLNQIPNAYKLNPKALKEIPVLSDRAYRGTKGRGAYDDYVKTGVVKSPNKEAIELSNAKWAEENPGSFFNLDRTGTTPLPSFAQGKIIPRYIDDAGYIFETNLPTKKIRGKHGVADFPYDINTGKPIKEVPSSSITNVYPVKPHWWKGHNPVKQNKKIPANQPLMDEELVDLYRIQERDAKTFSQLAKEGRLHPAFNNPSTLAKKAKEEKYFGQWFTKDKADLDWYARDREFINPEIKHLKIPKTKLNKYSNYDKSLSRAPDREFVIPQNEQSLYKQIEVPKTNFKVNKKEKGGLKNDITSLRKEYTPQLGDDVGTVIETPSEYQTGGPDQSFRDGVKHVESADGKLMRNPVSSATGFYGQLYSEIKNIPDMKGISRDKFQSDTTLQNTILNRRWEGDIPGIPGLDSSANDLTDEYKSQLKGKWNYTHDEVAALVNFMGRQGTRKYFASLRTGTTHKVPGVNKTPEEYLEEYRLGAGSSQTTYAPKHVLGKDEFTYKGRPTVTYKQDATGNWFINTKGGNGKYVPIVDPEGNRSDILNKYTVKSKSKK